MSKWHKYDLPAEYPEYSTVSGRYGTEVEAFRKELHGLEDYLRSLRLPLHAQRVMTEKFASLQSRFTSMDKAVESLKTELRNARL